MRLHALALALAAGAVPTAGHSAAFTPGEAPLSTDVQASSGPTNGNGFQFTVAPIRYWGVAALDLRYRELGGDRSLGEVLTATVNGATYVWQPWFLQVNGSLGVVGSAEDSGQLGTTRNVSGIGSLDLGLFPASRFPLHLYADVSDSRARAEITDIDYRTYRYRISQSYAPTVGSERYFASIEQSTLRSLTSEAQSSALAAPEAEDRLQLFRLSASKAWQQSSLDGEVSVSRNRREEGDIVQQTAIDLASLRHLMTPRPDLTVASGLSYTRTAVDAPRPLTIPTELSPGARTSSDFAQLTSFASFRPVPGGPFYREQGSVLGTATFRAFDFSNKVDESSSASRGATAALGLSYSLTPQMQLYSNSQAGYAYTAGEDQSVIAQTLGALYTAEPIDLGRFRYAWNVSGSATAGVQSGGENAGGNFLGNAAASHSLTRSFSRDRGDAFQLTLSQGAGYLYSTLDGGSAMTLVNSLSGFWNGPAAASGQAFAGFTLSDARRFGDTSGYYQLANVQGNVQLALSRWSTFSGGLTLQASRIHEERDFDIPFGAFVLTNQDEWRVTYGANLQYTHVRAFGVQRLLYTALLEASSFDYDSRALGNPEGAFLKLDWRFEHRLEYRIGRLILLANLRWAQVQGGPTGFQALLRAERQFGWL